MFEPGTRRGLMVAGLFAVGLLIARAGPSAAAPVVLAATVDEAISSRLLFGWPTDPATIASLRAGADVGTEKWGIAMTKAEETDLLERMTIEQNLETALLPFVRSLPSSGGAWIDQLRGGRLIVTLTTRDTSIQDKIRQLLPAENRGLDFAVGDDTERNLEAAVYAAEGVWSQSGSPARLLGATLDIPGNRVILRFTAEDLARALPWVDQVQADLDVSVVAQIGEVSVDTACTSRDNCYSPLKAGNRIYEDFVGSGGWCSMGFHVVVGGNRQFMTSGHCGITDTSQIDWYHSVNFGFVGNETANLITAGNSPRRDVMRIDLLDSQASTQIYGQGGFMDGWTLPTMGMAITVSLGRSATIKTGTVQQVLYSWTSTTCSCTVWGGDASWTTIGGDSGSPVYRVVGPTPLLYAVGVNATAVGQFARVSDAMSVWGASIYQ